MVEIYDKYISTMDIFYYAQIERKDLVSSKRYI